MFKIGDRKGSSCSFIDELQGIYELLMLFVRRAGAFVPLNVEIGVSGDIIIGMSRLYVHDS